MCITNAISVSAILPHTLRLADAFTTAPYIPPIDPSNASDTQNFDDTFLDMEPVLDEYVDETDQEQSGTDAERTDDESSNNNTPSQSRSSSSVRPASTTDAEESVDVFDGYSFKGRHSVLLDDDVEELALASLRVERRVVAALDAEDNLEHVRHADVALTVLVRRVQAHLREL